MALVSKISNKQKPAQKAYADISLITVISAIAVVYMHLCGFHGMYPAFTPNYLLALLIEKICVFAVPVFFMISGAMLLDYREKYDDVTFLRKRIRRTLIPWLAWSSISFIYAFAFHHLKGNQLPPHFV